MTTKGVDYRAVNYLEEPLSVDALKQLLCSVGLTPQDALRKIEGVYRQYVAGQNLRDDQLVRVMAAELGIGFESERCLTPTRSFHAAVLASIIQARRSERASPGSRRAASSPASLNDRNS